MTTGRRNRMCKSLEMRAFLKLMLNWSDNDIYVLTCIPMLCKLTCVASLQHDGQTELELKYELE